MLGETMFQGSLSEIKLPDVIQLLSAGSKTGAFKIERQKINGAIYLTSGQISHAMCGRLRGEQAIYTMAIWHDGSFQFVEGETSKDTTISKNNAHILMEVARKLDEWRVLSKKIPSLEHIPELETLGQKKVSFNTQEWSVLSKINGVDDITSIAESSSILPIDAAKLIYGLVASGMVKLRLAPKSQPDQNPLLASTQKDASTNEKEKRELLEKIEKIYQESKKILEEFAHPVVQRHCAKGVKEVDKGGGLTAVVDVASQIIKATQILEGSEKAKQLTTALKTIIRKS